MFEIFIYLTLFIGLIPLVIFFFNRKKVSNETYYFLPFVILIAVSSVYEFFGTMVYKIDVNLWFWVYLLLEFVTISYFFYRFSVNKKTVKIFALCYLLLYLILSLNRHGDNNLLLEGYLSAFSFVAFIVFSTLWFRKLFTDLSSESLLKNDLFYFISGIMIYFTGTIILFVFSDVLYIDNRESFSDFWMVNVYFSFLFRIIIIMGVWKSRIQ